MLSRLLKEHQAKQNERKDLQGQWLLQEAVAPASYDANRSDDKNKAFIHYDSNSFPVLCVVYRET